MPVTEVALCRLSPNVTIDDPVLRSKFAHAKAVMQKYTGRRFYLLQHNHDPSDLFIVGEWDSLEQHMNDFIPGPENQEILKGFEDLMTVDWLLHIDAPHADLPFPKSDAEWDKAIHEGLVITIIRTFVANGKREHIQKDFELNNQVLQDFVTEGTPGIGWRIDRWLDREECLLFIPWKSQQQHDEFLCPKNVSRLSMMGECINGLEIKHATILNI